MPTKITVSSGSNIGSVDYVYSADGIKLRKVNNNGTTTDYAGSFVYENGNLKQFDHAEGYVEPDGNGWQYVYRYADIWGNTRITYADDNNDGNIDASSEIRREQNYYPFGLEHKGYNNMSYGVKNNLKTYQGQEFTEDLGLNVHEWKFRMSDPAIGRFWQVDPLAEDYTYNSTYAFQENKMGMGRELEGLELFPINPTDMFNFKGGKGKPVLTFGLHKVVLPIAERNESGGVGAFIENTAKAIYNGAASTFNDGMQGKNMGDITSEGMSQMAETADRIIEGEGTVEDAENMVAAGAMMVVRGKMKGKGNNKPSIQQQALDVKKNLNNGKNSVNVGTVDGVTHFDLDGATHKGVKTPHVQKSVKNTNPNTGKTFINKDNKSVRPMTQQDIRTVKKVLEKRKENNGN